MEEKNIDDVLMERVAASDITDVHHERAISETEWKVLQKLLDKYNLEIQQAKEIISKEIPDIHIPDEDDELLGIPQEPYQPFESKKSK